MHFLKKHKKITIVMIILPILLLIILLDLYASKHMLQNTVYEVSTSKMDSPVRIVQLTDLHNSEFGQGNEKLIRKVKEQEADLVCITGDLLNLDEDNTEIAENLISKLAEDFPVYVSLGNHEALNRYVSVSELRERFEQAGAVVLEFDYEDITVNGVSLRIGGFYGYGLPGNSEAVRENESEFLEDFQDTDAYKVLLMHMPLAWYYSDSLNYWDVDLVLAGHTHGGQIRIPFVGGMYAPDMGWFPGRECGLYYSDDGEKVMVLSRGLGSTERVPRFNNIPEIVTVNIEPEA